MVGARSLAMALNRLIDAELDARNPRTATRELPPGGSRARRWSASASLSLARVPRRGVAARPDRALALADPGRRRSSSTRTSSASPGSRTSGSAPSTGSRRSARGSRSPGVAVGGVGARRRRRVLGRGLRPLLRAARPRRRPARGAALVGDALRRARRVRGRARAARADGRVPRRRRARASTSASSTGSASLVVAALLVYEHSLIRPGRPAPARRGVLHRERRDQRRSSARLRAARRAVIRARGLERRYGAKRVLRGLDLDVARGDFMVVTGANGSGRRRCCASSPGLAAPTGGELTVDVGARAARLPRARAARLPRADRAREPRSSTARLYRVPERARADRDAARAVRPLGRAQRARLDRSRAGCCSGSRSAARCSTSRRCCCSTSRSSRSTPTAPRCSTASSPSARGRATFLVATHDPDRLAPLATPERSAL